MDDELPPFVQITCGRCGQTGWLPVPIPVAIIKCSACGFLESVPADFTNQDISHEQIARQWDVYLRLKHSRGA